MREQLTLAEAKRLHKMGFAIHWLKPNSKMPLESGWTSGPRKDWKELIRSFQARFNIGVRLGEASKIGSHYLCVIDVDVKSTVPHHREEAEEALEKLLSIGGVSKLPVVESGRGGGSKHLYCKTDEPFKTFNFAESDKLVLVKMPSKSPSKKEIEELTEKQIKDGWRLSRAWEISLYSEGRQVVLPPSIHPDSGKEYKWEKLIRDENSIPVFDIEKVKAEKGLTASKSESGRAHSRNETAHSRSTHARIRQDQDKSFSFKIVEGLDVAFTGVSEKIVTLIRDGMWKGEKINRSDFLPVAAQALFKARCSLDEVMTILTDQENELGCCGYDHAKTKNRMRAGYWVYRYSVKKVESEFSAKTSFASEPIDENGGRVLSDEEAKAQAEGLESNPEEMGFYKKGERGALKPMYGALLKAFEIEHPYKTIADMKCVYTFNKTHYQDATPIEIKGYAERKFTPKPDEKIRNEFLTKVLANNIVRREFFHQTTEGCLNFQNGILDLNVSDALKAHSPDYGFRGVLPYNYDPKARCPTFRRWIKNIMMGDEALVNILQEYMGYIIRGGEYKYHKALWLDGVGRNGKSTFIDVLKSLIGVGNFSVLSIKSLMQDKFAGADLDGKIANFSEETSPQELADSGPFKNLTGNGDVFAQKKFGDPFSFRNRAKLVMSYNTIPDLKDLSPGMLSRPLIIPFKKLITEDEMDREIGKKLNEELSGIFNFALEGWHRLEAQGGFTRSEKSEFAMKKVKEESCNVFQWVENSLEFVDANFGEESDMVAKPKDLYSAYVKSERYPFKFIEFCRRLNTHPEMKLRHTKNEKRQAVYEGVILQ